MYVDISWGSIRNFIVHAVVKADAICYNIVSKLVKSPIAGAVELGYYV